MNAYAAATFYSVDRFASYRQDWGQFYESGGLVIADRYTTSNAVHQTPKLPREERRAFLKWLFDFEYRLLELPKPDRVVYLDLPTEISEKMMRRREEKTHTQADIHERDEAYLAACRESAELIITLCGWEKIDCSRDGQIRSPGGHPPGGARPGGGSACPLKGRRKGGHRSPISLRMFSARSSRSHHRRRRNNRGYSRFRSSRRAEAGSQ